MAAERSAPLISIVVPAFNREHYLTRTLDSVIAQTVADWELVVSDDGSTDATPDVARTYAAEDPRIRLVSAANGGVAAARNRGYAATNPNSSYVTFLDSDDLWAPDALEVLSTILNTNEAYAAAYGIATCIDDEDRDLVGDDLPARMRERRGLRDGKVVLISPDEPTTFSEMVLHNWIVTPGVCLTRRAVTQRVGGFDPWVDPADDWDLAVRTSRCGAIGFADRNVLYWRRHPNTLTNTSGRWKQAYYRVRRKMLTDPHNTEEQIRLVLTCYRLDFQDRVAAARQLVRRRDIPGAAREAARATDRLARYMRARVSARSPG